MIFFQITGLLSNTTLAPYSVELKANNVTNSTYRIGSDSCINDICQVVIMPPFIRTTHYEVTIRTTTESESPCYEQFTTKSLCEIKHCHCNEDYK